MASQACAPEAGCRLSLIALCTIFVRPSGFRRIYSGIRGVWEDTGYDEDDAADRGGA